MIFVLEELCENVGFSTVLDEFEDLRWSCKKSHLEDLECGKAQPLPTCTFMQANIWTDTPEVGEAFWKRKKGEANITGFTSSKSYQASIHKIFHQTSDIDRSNFSWGIEQKVVDILLIENHSLTLEIPNLWEAIPGSSFPNWALGEILKLQRIGASFLSCSNQLWILLETAFIHKCLENWDPKNKKDSQLFLHFKRLAKLPGIFCLDFSWSWATGS